MNNIQEDDAVNARKWLAQHNSAWLFRDGFYAVPAGGNALEVRTLGGKPVWRAEIDASGDVQYRPLQNGISSDYRIPDYLWRRAQDSERRNEALSQRMGQRIM